MSQRDLPALCSITEWRLLHSGKPTSLPEPCWTILTAEPASHEECSTWNIVARTVAITCSGTALLRLPRFLNFFVCIVHFIHYDHCCEHHGARRRLPDDRTLIRYHR